MASSWFLLLFCSFLHMFNQFPAQFSYSPGSVFLPVTKDSLTLQYVAEIYRGTPLVPTKLVVDLGGPFLWVDCDSGHSSPSRRLIPSCSIQCAGAKAFVGKSCFSGNGPAHHRTTCDLSTENTITRAATRGEISEDSVAVRSIDGSKTGPITTVDSFLFSCAPASLLSGLANGVQGMLGLGRSQIALPSQLDAVFGFQRKFTICLSSSNGVILFGNAPIDSIFGTEISSSITYTALLKNPEGSSEEYFINLKSMSINGRRLSFTQEGTGVAKISSVVPFTAMESSVYNTFIKAYAKAAASMNMTRVPSVSPFGLCFSSEGIAITELGPKVPTIDLSLQSEMVKWRIHGRNAMVPVRNGVMCLGLLDGGLNPDSSVVIGAFQLEDTLVEFDLGRSMLGFSSSLSARQKSCSNFVLDSRLQESL